MTMRAAIVVVLGCLGGVTLGGCVFYLNPLCNDQIANGDETGVDCGGSCATKCQIGQGCKTAVDCDDADCVSGACTAKPCDNGKQDPGETDVDCGGGMCRACPGGRKCVADTDCFGMGGCNPATKTCSELTLSFAPETRYFSGFKAYALLGGDLDGDGHTDLAVINEYGSSVGVFLDSFSTGAFARVSNPAGKPKDEPDNRALNFGPVGAYPTGGGMADFNHDGHLDVVTADYHGDSVTVLLNDGKTGALNLQPPASYPTQDKAETSNLAVGDLNNDGNPDVVASNPQRASISMLLGRPDGTLAPAINLPVGVTGGSQPFSAAIADFNGDGNNDVAVPDNTSGMMFVRLGHGDGTFEPEVPYDIGGAQSFIVIASDVNLDGKVDLVVADRSSDTVSVLLGHGDGTFKKAIVSSVVPPGVTFPSKGRPWFGPYAVAVADINQDGVPDIVTPNFLDDSVTILLGIGNGHFDPAIELKFGPPTDPLVMAMFTTPYGIVAADFNGDGKIDFATANAGSDDLAIRLNTGQKQ
jgi:FG-GAP-like repeat/FG-GAP repeat